MKKILLLGGSGLVGSRVIELLDKDFEIIAPTSSELDLNEAGNFEKYCLSQQFSELTVLNFVAFTNVDVAESETGQENGLVYRLNAILPGEVADWCKENSSRLIHISTDYVFDGSKESSPYVEEDKTNPLGWYGKTKLYGEQFVEESGADFVTLRIEMPYGSKSEKKKDLATILYERLRDNLPIQAIDDAQITPIFIDEFVLILARIIEQQDVVGLYHFGPADSTSLWQFVRSIAKCAQLSDSLVTTISFENYWKDKIASGSAKRPKHSWLNSSKLSKALGLEFNTIEKNIEDWFNLLHERS